MSVDDIIKVVASGGGVILSAEGRTVSDLVRISATAADGESTIVIKNAGTWLTSDLVHIAAAGRGHVMIEV